MSGTLYLIATPIGNLGDLSPRAAAVLESADFIAAEDTRVTMKLLSHLGLKKPMVSYHEHNKAAAGPAAGGGELRPGHRRRHPRHQRPGRGPGGAVRRKRGDCAGRAGVLCADLRSGGQRTAYRAVCF